MSKRIWTLVVLPLMAMTVLTSQALAQVSEDPARRFAFNTEQIRKAPEYRVGNIKAYHQGIEKGLATQNSKLVWTAWMRLTAEIYGDHKTQISSNFIGKVSELTLDLLGRTSAWGPQNAQNMAAMRSAIESWAGKAMSLEAFAFTQVLMEAVAGPNREGFSLMGQTLQSQVDARQSIAADSKPAMASKSHEQNQNESWIPAAQTHYRHIAQAISQILEWPSTESPYDPISSLKFRLVQVLLVDPTVAHMPRNSLLEKLCEWRAPITEGAFLEILRGGRTLGLPYNSRIAPWVLVDWSSGEAAGHEEFQKVLIDELRYMTEQLLSSPGKYTSFGYEVAFNRLVYKMLLAATALNPSGGQKPKIPFSMSSNLQEMIKQVVTLIEGRSQVVLSERQRVELADTFFGRLASRLVGSENGEVRAALTDAASQVLDRGPYAAKFEAVTFVLGYSKEISKGLANRIGMVLITVDPDKSIERKMDVANALPRFFIRLRNLRAAGQSELPFGAEVLQKWAQALLLSPVLNHKLRGVELADAAGLADGVTLNLMDRLSQSQDAEKIKLYYNHDVAATAARLRTGRATTSGPLMCNLLGT